jgi:hypothetical protein
MSDAAITMLIEDAVSRDYRGLTVHAPANIRDDSNNGPHCLQLRRCVGVRLIDSVIRRDEHTENGINLFGCSKCSIVRPTITGGDPTRDSADAITVDAGCSGSKVDLTGGSINCLFRAVCFADGTGHYLLLGPHTKIRSPMDQPIAIDPYYGHPVSVTVVGASAKQRKLIYVAPGCTVKYVEHL